MSKQVTIPEHKKCIGCGQCCGPIFISDLEDKAIKEYVKKMDIFTKQRLKNQKKDIYTCQFRDKLKNNCAIYPVRPLICKLFGVTRGMQCPQGNTCEINGYKLITAEERHLIPYYLGDE
jgi:hypothetical protein